MSAVLLGEFDIGRSTEVSLGVDVFEADRFVAFPLSRVAFHDPVVARVALAVLSKATDFLLARERTRNGVRVKVAAGRQVGQTNGAAAHNGFGTTLAIFFLVVVATDPPQGRTGLLLGNPRHNLLTTARTQILVLTAQIMLPTTLHMSQLDYRTTSHRLVCCCFSYCQ